MISYKTNEYLINSNLDDDAIISCLKKYIKKKHFFQLTKDCILYGVVKRNKAIFELGQFPFRNSFRPIAVISWNRQDGIAKVKSYIRMDRKFLLLIICFLVYGIYLSIVNSVIVPFVINVSSI